MNQSEQQDVSDEVLMGLFQSKKESKLFELLYNRHFVSLSKYLYWLTNDVERGKDIAQDIFYKVYNEPDLFNSSQSFKVWLFSIAKNRWKNHIRKRSIELRHKKHVSKESSPNEKPDEISPNGPRIKKVESAMNLLSESHREVVTLKYLNNLTIDEIAEISNCSKGTIKSRIFYALKNLKKSLNHDDK